jgi:hypothetical protein
MAGVDNLISLLNGKLSEIQNIVTVNDIDINNFNKEEYEERDFNQIIKKPIKEVNEDLAIYRDIGTNLLPKIIEDLTKGLKNEQLDAVNPAGDGWGEGAVVELAPNNEGNRTFGQVIDYINNKYFKGTKYANLRGKPREALSTIQNQLNELLKTEFDVQNDVLKKKPLKDCKIEVLAREGVADDCKFADQDALNKAIESFSGCLSGCAKEVRETRKEWERLDAQSRISNAERDALRNYELQKSELRAPADLTEYTPSSNNKKADEIIDEAERGISNEIDATLAVRDKIDKIEKEILNDKDVSYSKWKAIKGFWSKLYFIITLGEKPDLKDREILENLDYKYKEKPIYKKLESLKKQLNKGLESEVNDELLTKHINTKKTARITKADSLNRKASMNENAQQGNDEIYSDMIEYGKSENKSIVQDIGRNKEALSVMSAKTSKGFLTEKDAVSHRTAKDMNRFNQFVTENNQAQRLPGYYDVIGRKEIENNAKYSLLNTGRGQQRG